MITNSAEETITIGRRLGKILKPGDIVCLQGNLGAGKTTIVKGIVEGLKADARAVNSPTFVLMNMYDGKVPVYHFDLYRIEGRELENIGYDEFFYGKGVTIVEWAERLGAQMPENYFMVQLEHVAEEQRSVTVSAVGADQIKRLTKLKM